MSDPNKKSPRTFQCRDVLWETFEQMARELECSVDYLINESMKQYARQRSYGSRGSLPGRETAPVPSAPSRPSAPHGHGAPPPPLPGGGGGPGMPPPPPPPKRGSLPPPPPPTAHARSPRSRTGGAVPPPPGGAGGRFPPPPPPAKRHGGAVPPPAAPSGRGGPPPPARGAPPLPPAPGHVPPPFPGRGPAAPAAPAPAPAYAPAPAAASQQLTVWYNNQPYSITKDRFIIGRGRQSSDLTIKDPNVSRQHAMIEFLKGDYYMVDMGSTNGIEYNGQRIARKVVHDGDVFRICDHDLRFSFR